MFLKIIFNTWTTIVIKEKVDNEQKSCVNFKINKPKQKMCNQLHATWMKVKGMKSMIMKGWDKKLLITRAFKFNFQLVALQANVVASLFTMIQSIGKQMERYLNANPTLPLSIIMGKCF